MILSSWNLHLGLAYLRQHRWDQGFLDWIRVSNPIGGCWCSMSSRIERLYRIDTDTRHMYLIEGSNQLMTHNRILNKWRYLYNVDIQLHISLCIVHIWNRLIQCLQAGQCSGPCNSSLGKWTDWYLTRMRSICGWTRPGTYLSLSWTAGSNWSWNSDGSCLLKDQWMSNPEC